MVSTVLTAASFPTLLSYDAAFHKGCVTFYRHALFKKVAPEKDP